jgi:hypothetical protein
MHNRDCLWTAATAWFIGLGALVSDHFRPSPPVSLGIHAPFAVATCGAICLVLIAKARAIAGTSQHDLYQMTRLVSRWVYILLYALAMVRVLLYLYEASQHCGSCTATTTVNAVRSLDDFQLYVVFCAVPLWVVRTLVLKMPFRRESIGTANEISGARAVERMREVEGCDRPRYVRGPGV